MGSSMSRIEQQKIISCKESTVKISHEFNYVCNKMLRDEHLIIPF